MTDWLSPSADAALRSVDAPPLSADFSDRVMAGLDARLRAKPEARSAADRRGPWKRRRVILMTGLAAGLLSVGAAASGLFGVSIRNMPVVGVFVERLSPAKPVFAAAKPIPKPPVSKPKARLSAAPIAEPVASVSDQPPLGLPGMRRELRREVVAQRIADRMQERDERRQALGLPSRPQAMAPKMRERLRALPPAEHAVLLQRVREIRAERPIPAGDGATPVPEGAPLFPVAEPRPMFRGERLTPEQRERIRLRRERRAAERNQFPQ